MSLATRRFLYIAFILLFLIITPVVIAFAAGYQFTFSWNFKGIQLQKTGMLILDTEPRGAKIYINGVPQQVFLDKFLADSKIFGSGMKFITTPAKIKNLLPGEYDVRLELDGYWVWQKKLLVKGGESTYAETVSLFKDNLPLLIDNAKVMTYSLSPDGKYIAILSDGEITLVSTDNDNEIQKIALQGNSNDIIWSPDSSKIISGNFVYSLSQPGSPLNLFNIVKGNSKNFKWNADNNAEIFCQTSADGKKFDAITKINYPNMSSSTVITGTNSIDYYQQDGYFYIIDQNGDYQKIDIYDQNSGSLGASLELSRPYDYKFIDTDSKYINIFNRKQGALYLINPSEKNLFAAQIDDVEYAAWAGNGRLFYNNDFEIWAFNTASNQKSLLTRISSPIKKIMLHPSNNYVLFATDNSIDTIELDDREKRNITELIRLDKISEPFLNKKGDVLYFVAKIGNSEGVYKLLLQ